MEEFFGPLVRNTTGGSSSFNLHDSYVSSAEIINGYFVNNTEKYLFSDSEPSAAPQAFYAGTVTSSFLPDFSALPLQNLESTLTEQNRNELNQLNGGIEGQDAITMSNKNFNPSISWELLQQEAILLEGKEQNNQNNHNFPLPYETPLPVEGSEARKTNFSNSRGDKSKQNYVNSATNGQVKTRTRARRGQATDPHSIAERQRREKISMRLKNLQELVPNSNKIDKALMLEEVIEYVKFLQIQVKMLSMSRLGGPGASLPLLADSQTENCMENSIERRGIMDPEEGLGLERGVVRLMECNMIDAIQFIQPKGLCLVPLKLASLIYNQNESAI